MLLNVCAQSLNLCYILSILFAIVVYNVINSLDVKLYDKTCNKYNALSRPFMTSIMVYCQTYYIMVSIVSLLSYVLHVYFEFCLYDNYTYLSVSGISGISGGGISLAAANFL